MFVTQILFSVVLLAGGNYALAATELPAQQDVDRAFELILNTEVGQAICRDILGADAAALELHLGVSIERAEVLARDCRGAPASEWIYPTSPADIRKLSLKANRPHRYRLMQIDETFPIESWTDAIGTTILVHSKNVAFNRLVQILAHETAVYFDSKSHPLHASAQDLPHLRGLNLRSTGKMDPLVAASNPMQAHTLTYLRALQVEFAILRELVAKGLLQAPADLSDPYLNHLVSERCQEACIEELLINTRAIYRSFSLPLLAFSSSYRQMALRELPQLKPAWEATKLEAAQEVLNNLPVAFMRDKFSRGQFLGDVVGDLSRFFFKDPSLSDANQKVDRFLDQDLWPLELTALSQSRFAGGVSLLAFLKRPLLSGYNISLASGPRVRVRTGNIE